MINPDTHFAYQDFVYYKAFVKLYETLQNIVL